MGSRDLDYSGQQGWKKVLSDEGWTQYEWLYTQGLLEAIPARWGRRKVKQEDFLRLQHGVRTPMWCSGGLQQVIQKYIYMIQCMSYGTITSTIATRWKTVTEVCIDITITWTFHLNFFCGYCLLDGPSCQSLYWLQHCNTSEILKVVRYSKILTEFTWIFHRVFCEYSFPPLGGSFMTTTLSTPEIKTVVRLSEIMT